ncbi:MAG: hypothetical protein M1827_007411 [Pycnora praestabilis]|nr:MAG: hypothetical protein M1827_007411 [Pycnora praestabilis]
MAPTESYPGLANLSFGVELEFFTAMKMVEFKKTRQETLRHLLGKRISDLQLQGPRGQGVKVKIVTAEELELGDKEGTNHRFWTVTRDSSIDPDHPEWFDDYEAQPMELVSPPYFIRSPYWEHDLNAILTTAVNTPVQHMHAEMYCELNSSTHLHIHIGNGTTGQGFPVESVRNLAMLVIVFEEEIDKMLADHMGFVSGTMWAASQVRNRSFKGLTTAGMTNRIWHHCRTIEDVVNIMCPQPEGAYDPDFRRYYKYNFLSLLSQKQTVEFRQHQGTLNPKEIINWVHFLGCLVELAHSIRAEDLERLVHRKDSAEVNITELFAAIAIIAGHLPLDASIIDHYAGLIHARGMHIRTRTHMRIRDRTSGTKIISWLPKTRSEVAQDRETAFGSQDLKHLTRRM